MFHHIVQAIKKNFHFYAPRIAYDFLLAIVILFFAVNSRILLFVFSSSTMGKAYPLFENYSDNFFYFSFGFAFLVIMTNMFCGLYATDRFKTSLIKRSIIHVLGASILAPILLFAVVRFMSPDLPFSRAVLPFLAIYMFIFLYVPRMGKVFIRGKVFKEVLLGANKHKRKSVLVIGGCGYIGSILVRKLLKLGYQVNVLDSIMFGKKSLEVFSNHPKLKLIEGDFRNVETVIRAMNNVSSVIHLGGIVGDPACSLDRDFTIEVNLSATTMLVECCKLMNIRQFLFASSCSVYGRSENNSILTEKSALNPLSLYAETKIAAEKILLDELSYDFHPVILRFATIFGISPRPRFDLVVNSLTAKAVCKGSFVAYRGEHFRPFVHVEDVAEALVGILEAPMEKTSGHTFNIGSNQGNCSLKEVEEKIVSLIPGASMEHREGRPDQRSYNVSFDKLKKHLGIELDRTLEEGILEIKYAIENSTVSDPLSSDREYSNVHRTEEILTQHIYEENRNQTPSHYKKTAKAILKEIR